MLSAPESHDVENFCVRPWFFVDEIGAIWHLEIHEKVEEGQFLMTATLTRSDGVCLRQNVIDDYWEAGFNCSGAFDVQIDDDPDVHVLFAEINERFALQGRVINDNHGNTWNLTVRGDVSAMTLTRQDGLILVQHEFKNPGTKWRCILPRDGIYKETGLFIMHNNDLQVVFDEIHYVHPGPS